MKTLRKIGLVFLAVMMCISFTACSDDDDDEKPNSNIVGTWELTWSKGYEIWEGEKSSWDEPVEDYFVTFNADGTGMDNDLEYPEDNEVFVWEVKGKHIYIQYEDDDVPSQGTIEKLNSTTLVISVVEEGYSDTNTFKRVK